MAAFLLLEKLIWFFKCTRKGLINELGVQRVELNDLLNELYTEFQNAFADEKSYEIKDTVIWLLPGQGMTG